MIQNFQKIKKNQQFWNFAWFTFCICKKNTIAALTGCKWKKKIKNFHIIHPERGKKYSSVMSCDLYKIRIKTDGVWKAGLLCTWASMCVWLCGQIMCAFILSIVPSSKPPKHPRVHNRARHVLSAVRRWRYCWLGDHYKGHKRAIYRSASEWSQHGRSSHPAALLCAGSLTKNRESEASMERDFYMKLTTMVVLAASGFSQMEETGIWLITDLQLSGIIIKKVTTGSSRIWETTGRPKKCHSGRWFILEIEYFANLLKPQKRKCIFFPM